MKNAGVKYASASKLYANRKKYRRAYFMRLVEQRVAQKIEGRWECIC